MAKDGFYRLFRRRDVMAMLGLVDGLKRGGDVFFFTE